MFLLLVKIKN